MSFVTISNLESSENNKMNISIHTYFTTNAILVRNCTLSHRKIIEKLGGAMSVAFHYRLAQCHLYSMAWSARVSMVSLFLASLEDLKLTSLYQVQVYRLLLRTSNMTTLQHIDAPMLQSVLRRSTENLRSTNPLLTSR